MKSRTLAAVAALTLLVSPYFASAAACVPTSSGNNTVTFATPGTCTYTVPSSFGTLTIELWGGGGGGYGAQAGADGSATTFARSGLPVVSAGGGKAPVANNAGKGGAGGSAQSGDTNTPGHGGGPSASGGPSGYGGDAADPNGGNGGASRSAPNTSTGNPGSAPGGGGGGSVWREGYNLNIDYLGVPGGGGGAYAKKTYTSGILVPGSTVTVTVGSGGSGGTSYFYNYPQSGCATLCHHYPAGGAGAAGKIIITWTNLPQNKAPNPPAITIQGNPSSLVSDTTNTFFFQSKDPDGDKLRYEISWNGDQVRDELLPASGWTQSNTKLSSDHATSTGTTATRDWTIQARACDDSGKSNACSDWAQKTISVTAAAPTAILTCKESGSSTQKSSCSFRQGDNPITLTWSSSLASSCTGDTSFSTGASKPTSGSTSVTPTATTTYTVTCSGNGGSASDSVTVDYRPNLPPDAPAVTLNGDEGPFTVRPNTSYTFKFVARDNDTPPDDLNYTISWNDGDPYVWLPSQRTYVRSGPQGAVSAAYTWGYFSENRRATFRAKATDQRGEPSATWTTVTVRCISTQQCNTAEKKLYDSCTNESTSCPNGCSGSTCNPSPPAKINSFYAKPALVPSGMKTKLYWDVENAKANGCSILGSNEEARDGLSGSMTSGWQTKAITAQTLYTLTCTGLDAKKKTAETAVSIVPVFQEL